MSPSFKNSRILSQHVTIAALLSYDVKFMSQYFPVHRLSLLHQRSLLETRLRSFGCTQPVSSESNFPK